METLKKDASLEDMRLAVNVLITSKPGMNNFISETFKKLEGKIESLGKEKQALADDVNCIAKKLTERIDSLLMSKVNPSWGFIWRGKVFMFSIKRLIKK